MTNLDINGNFSPFFTGEDTNFNCDNLEKLSAEELTELEINYNKMILVETDQKVISYYKKKIKEIRNKREEI